MNDLNIAILNYIDNIKQELNSDPEIKRLLQIKKEVINNKNLIKIKKQLDDFDNIYLKEYINLRTEFMNEPLIKEWTELENKLMYLTFEISQKLNSLTKEEMKCSK